MCRSSTCSVSAGRLWFSPRGTAEKRPGDVGGVGERCALNLAGPGVGRAATHRGDWIVAPPLHLPTARFDARIRLLASEPRPLAHWSSVFIHLGAARAAARVALL